MRKIILIFLILYTSNLFSQGRDMIKDLLECKNDSVRIDILKVIYDHVFDLEADSAKYYYTQIKSIAKKQNNKIIEAANLAYTTSP